MLGADEIVPTQADVVVIGGGITGCAAAYYLAARGVSVVLVEAGEIASAQSSRAWGFIRQQGRHPAEVPYAAQANRIWQDLTGELQADLEFVRGGILTPAETAADVERMRGSVEIAARNGLSTRLLSRSELRDLIPELKGDFEAGLYTAEDAHGEPRKATEAFAAAAARRGAALLSGTVVTGFSRSGGSVHSVLTSRGEIKARKIICAAGLGTPYLLKLLDASVPIHGMRISVVETEAAPSFTKTAIWAPQFASRPTTRGTFYVGSGYRGKVADIDVTVDALRYARYFMGGLAEHLKYVNLRLGSDIFRSLRSGTKSAFAEPNPNRRITDYNRRQFLRCFPHLGDLGVKRVWAGVVDITPDMVPVIGAVPGAPNVIVAAGYSGHGFALGPASGQLLSALALDDRPSIDLRPFRLTRFAENDYALAPGAL